MMQHWALFSVLVSLPVSACVAPSHVPPPTELPGEVLLGVGSFDGEDFVYYLSECVAATGECAAELPVAPGGTLDARFVLAAAPAGGDGSASAPFRTIAEALVGATDGTWIGVGPGAYPEEVVLNAAVTIVGACGFTNINGRVVVQSSSSIRRLGVAVETARAINVFAGASLSLENVSVASNLIGVSVGGALDASFVSVVSSTAIAGTRGSGVTVRNAQLQYTTAGVQVSSPAATLEDVDLQATEESAVGIDAQDGAEITLMGVAVTGGAVGVRLLETNRASIEQLFVQDVRPPDLGRPQDAALSTAHSRALRVRGFFAKECSTGAFIHVDTPAIVEDAFIAGPDTRSAVRLAGGAIELRRVAISLYDEGALHIEASELIEADASPSVTAQDITIGRASPDRPRGEGIFVSGNFESLHANRIAMSSVGEAGVLINTPASAGLVRLEDLSIETVGVTVAGAGAGIEVGRITPKNVLQSTFFNGRVELRRIAIRNSGGDGISIFSNDSESSDIRIAAPANSGIRIGGFRHILNRIHVDRLPREADAGEHVRLYATAAFEDLRLVGSEGTRACPYEPTNRDRSVGLRLVEANMPDPRIPVGAATVVTRVQANGLPFVSEMGGFTRLIVGDAFVADAGALAKDPSGAGAPPNFSLSSRFERTCAAFRTLLEAGP